MKPTSCTLILIVACLGLLSCGVNDDPVAPEDSLADVTVTLAVQPSSSLRTLETWNFWTLPVEVVFVATPGEADSGHHKVASIDSGQMVALLQEAESHSGLSGSIAVPGMDIAVEIAEAGSLWEFHHDGMEERHAEPGHSHVAVQVLETATGHHAHGSAIVSHCGVTLLAAPLQGDPIEVELQPVQGGHGFRYESNAAFPHGTYALTLEIEPPEFLRDDDTQLQWTTDMDIELGSFVFDDTFAGGTVGEGLWVGAAGDSLGASLRAGDVKTYGAVGIGQVPLVGNETVNFSLKLEDPTAEAHGEPLFGVSVIATLHNERTGDVVTTMLRPTYGEHGFHFGTNADLGLHSTGREPDDGHVH